MGNVCCIRSPSSSSIAVVPSEGRSRSSGTKTPNNNNGETAGGTSLIASLSTHAHESKQNATIEAMLKSNQAEKKKEHRVVVLGTGEAGKSTLIRHMSLVNGKTFSEAQLRTIAGRIQATVFDYIRSLLAYTVRQTDLDPKIREDLESLNASKIGDAFEGLAYNAMKKTSRSFGEFWSDSSHPLGALLHSIYKSRGRGPAAGHGLQSENGSGVADAAAPNQLSHDNDVESQAAFSLTSLPEHVDYFFDATKRIFPVEGEYVPTNEDMLRIRVRTTGISETILSVDNGSIIILVDVGGQRSERKKWLNCFGGLEAIMFVVGISEYDQVLLEDETVPRWRESLSVFETVCKTEELGAVPLIVFFNKEDDFDEKIARGDRPFADFVDLYKDPTQHSAILEEGLSNGNNNAHDGSAASCKRFMQSLYESTMRRCTSDIINARTTRTNTTARASITSSAMMSTKDLQSREAYFHFCTAIDEQNVTALFQSVRDIILKSALKSALNDLGCML